MMNIRWFLLSLLICAVVSAHRLPDEQETRASFFVDANQHKGITNLTIPAGMNNITFLLQYTDTDMPVQKLDVVHEKKMHIFVMGEDLVSFAHLHPEDNLSMDYRRGLYSLPIYLAKSGKYILAVDFYIQGIQQFHILDLTVTDGQLMAIPDTVPTDEFKDDYSSTLVHDVLLPNKENLFTFTLNKNGVSITDLEQFLGADLHVVIFSSDLTFAGHSHPMVQGHFGTMANMPQMYKGPSIPFSYTFPKKGNYVIFTQFQHQGQAHTARFLVQVDDPLWLPSIWFGAGALLVASLTFMYLVRRNIHKRIR